VERKIVTLIKIGEKTMQKLSIILFLLVFSIPIFSQDKVDIVYLKNGEVIRGTIIEFNAAENLLKIEMSDGTVSTLQYSDISRFTKESAETESPAIDFNETDRIREGSDPDFPTTNKVDRSLTKKFYFTGNRVTAYQDAEADRVSYNVNLNGFYSYDKRNKRWNLKHEYGLNYYTSGAGSETNSHNISWNILYDAKYYVSNSPFYLQSTLKGNQTVDLNVSDDADPYSTIYVGTGLGRIWDLARWSNTKEVENLLFNEGFLRQRFSRSDFTAVMNIISTTDDIVIRLDRLINYLDDFNLLSIQINAKTMLRLQSIVENSVRSLPSGFQVGAGILQELTTTTSTNKHTYASVYLEYNKPWSRAWLFSFPFNANFVLSSDSNSIDYHTFETEPSVSYDTDIQKFNVGYNLKYHIYSGDGEINNVFTDRFFLNYSRNIVGRLFLGAELSVEGRDFEGEGGEEDVYDEYGRLIGTEYVPGSVTHKYGFRVELSLDYYIFN